LTFIFFRWVETTNPVKWYLKNGAYHGYMANIDHHMVNGDGSKSMENHPRVPFGYTGVCLKMLGNAMESMGDAAARFHRLGDFRVSGRWRGTFVDARLQHDMFQNEKNVVNFDFQGYSLAI